MFDAVRYNAGPRAAPSWHLTLSAYVYVHMFEYICTYTHMYVHIYQYTNACTDISLSFSLCLSLFLSFFLSLFLSLSLSLSRFVGSNHPSTGDRVGRLPSGYKYPNMNRAPRLSFGHGLCPKGFQYYTLLYHPEGPDTKLLRT